MIQLIEGVMKNVQKYPSFGVLFGKAFCESYSEDFPEANLTKHQSNPSQIEHSQDLDEGATVLRSLLRVNIHLNKICQSRLNECFMGLFIDYNFKEHLSTEFVRMINFQIDWKKIGKEGLQERGNYTSKLMDISIQILTSEQLALKAIKKAGITNMLQGILKILKSYLIKG